MKEKQWVYYSPKFESDKYNLEMMRYSPWSGHRTFAYDYVANKKPKIIVELGSYYGCSAFSFLQAIKDHNLKTDFFGVDTWEGDSFTSSDYREDIYSQYKKIQEGCFQKQNAYMLRRTFDDAVILFEDASVDLLHIDGSHTYEDVKHDFFTWKEKVKKKGVVFFHDISEAKLDDEVMGSHVFWRELKAEYPYTAEFPFSFGLGILFFDENQFLSFKNGISFEHYQQIVNHEDVQNKDVIRKDYFEIRDLRKFVDSLKTQVETDRIHLDQYKKTVDGKDVYINRLEQHVKILTEKCRDTFEQSQLASEGFQRDIADIKEGIAQKEAYIGELRRTIRKYDEDSGIKDKYIRKLEVQIENLNEAVRSSADDLMTAQEYHKREISDYKKTVDGKEYYIEQLLETIKKYNTTVTDKDNYISELRNTIGLYADDAEKKDIYITEILSELQKLRMQLDVEKRKMSNLQMEYETLLQKQKEMQQLAEDLQVSLNETNDILNRYKLKLSGSIIGRRFLKKVENNND